MYGGVSGRLPASCITKKATGPSVLTSKGITDTGSVMQAAESGSSQAQASMAAPGRIWATSGESQNHKFWVAAHTQVALKASRDVVLAVTGQKQQQILVQAAELKRAVEAKEALLSSEDGFSRASSYEVDEARNKCAAMEAKLQQATMLAVEAGAIAMRL